MKRTLSMVLVLAMIFTALLGVVSFAGSESEGALEVSQANLEFSTAVYLYIAVDYSAVGSANGITLKITNNKTGESTILSPDSSISAPANCVAFKYIDLGAKNMGDELTLQALKDGKASGDAKTYSVLEYALKAQGQGNAKLAALMVAMLQYGADAQAALNHTGTYDLSKSWGMVVSPNATISKTILEMGKPVTLVPKDATKTAIYTTDLDRVSDNPTFTVNKTYQSLIFVNEAMRTNFAFDFDNYTGATNTLNSNFTESGASSKITYYTTQTSIAIGSKTGMTNPVGMSVNSGALTEAKPDGGYRTISNGYLRIVTGKNVGFDTNVTAPDDYISEGKFTVTFSIKKVGNIAMQGGPRFRSDKPARYELYLYGASGDKIYLSGTGSGVVLGTCSPDEYLTFHIVVDIKAGLFYGYDAYGNLIGSCSATLTRGNNKANFDTTFGTGTDAFEKFMSDTPWFNWSMAANKGVEINKYIVTKGNIFE